MDANPRIATSKTNIIERELSYTLNGIFFEVHNAIGRFCHERQYCDAIAATLTSRGIPFEREKVLPPMFDGEPARRHRTDFVIDSRVVVEVKAKPAIERNDFVQVHRYLAALRLKLGILVNFGTKLLVPRRVLNSQVP